MASGVIERLKWARRAPPRPIRQAPKTKASRRRKAMSLPSAAAAVSLLRMARIMRPQGERNWCSTDRKRLEYGKSVYVRVEPGGRRIIQKKRPRNVHR